MRNAPAGVKRRAGRGRRSALRRRSWGRAAASGITLLALLAACGGEPVRPPAVLAALPASSARPDLSGRWVLERERAAQADGELRAIARAVRHADPLAVAAAPSEVPAASGVVPGAWETVFVAPRSLDVHHADPVLRITTLGRTRELHTDLRGTAVSAGTAARQEVSVAGWENAAVVVETALGEGATLIQRYRLEAGGAELHVDYLYDLPRLEEPVTLTLVYQRARSLGSLAPGAVRAGSSR
jgi:hypothetical protein